MWRCATCSPWDDRRGLLRHEEGSGLLLVLLVIPVATALAGLLVLATSAHTLTTLRFQHTQHVRYAARALAERVVSELRQQADWTPIVSGGLTSSFSGGALTWEPGVGTPVDLELRGEALQADTNTNMPRGADTPRWRLYAWGLVEHLATPATFPSMPVFLGAWVADDGEDGDGDPFADSNRAVMVRAEAFGRDNAGAAVTAIVARGAKGLEDVWRLSWKDEP